MQCKEVQEKLADYLSGQLPEAERSAIRIHLGHCHACAEEAARMDLFSRRLSEELKLWADQGVCPPEVMERIEKSLRHERRKAFWRTRRGHMVMAAAAAAVFLVALAGFRPDAAPGQLASLPLVGSLAAPLLTVGNSGLEDAGAQAVPINLTAERDGDRLVVNRVLTTGNATQVQFSVPLGTPPGEPELRGPEGLVRVHRMTSRTAGSSVVVTAEFDPVPAGEEVTLTVQGMSVTFRTE